MGSISKSKTQESRCLLRLTGFSRAGVVLIDRLVQFIKPGCLPLIQSSSRKFKFSASDLQTLDLNFLSLATLNISWKRFATVKALNVENDSVVPSTATVFAHGMYNL
ncbi:hypothetical protein Hanom_Chr00s000003g01604861 [Helianthus anomalus]